MTQLVDYPDFLPDFNNGTKIAYIITHVARDAGLRIPLRNLLVHC